MTMRDNRQGRPFHGEFSSADASALSESNSRIALYVAESTTAVTLAANERVVITDINVILGSTSVTVTLYDGSDTTVGAGEQILKGTFSANGGISCQYQVPHYCRSGPTNGYPKVKTSASGQVDVTIRGVIEKLGQ